MVNMGGLGIWVLRDSSPVMASCGSLCSLGNGMGPMGIAGQGSVSVPWERGVAMAVSPQPSMSLAGVAKSHGAEQGHQENAQNSDSEQ